MTVTFTDLGVPAGIAARLQKLGLDAPFPIQVATLPEALAGRDIAGKAPTGSGKTLAFSLPLAARTPAAAPHRPTGLVLVPTRELATQVAETLAPLAAVRDRSVATVFGGTPIARDVRRLRQGVDILVACPGRLDDLVKRREVSLRDVTLAVLDEADRMADMGFLPVVTRLLDATAKPRQTLLFSATLDGEVDRLVRAQQRDPVRHEVPGDEERRGDVQHVFWEAERPARRPVTVELLRRHQPAIVFTRTKRGADRLAKQLAQDGIATAAIHGDRSQGQREKALARFSDGGVTALIATDVAARGIHVDDVALVVHYDLPADHKDYVHRSGRTGRAGADGLVVAFSGQEQRRDLHGMQRRLGLPEGADAPDVRTLGTAAGAGADQQPEPRRAPTPSRGGQPRGGGGGRPRHPEGRDTEPNRQRSGRRRHAAGGAARSTSPRGGARDPARRR